MPIIEYVLLALLGSAAIPGGTPGGPLTRNLTADAVTQPNGGTEGLVGQKKPSKRRSHLEARRHHQKGHRRGKVIAGSKVSSSTGGAGGVKRNANAQPRPPRPRRASNSNKNSK